MRTMSREEAIEFISTLSAEEKEKVLEFILELREQSQAEETGSRKERLLALMSEYEQELAEAEYTAEVKDPERMDIIDALWKARNLITGEEALKRYRKETEGENPAYMRDPSPKG